MGPCLCISLKTGGFLIGIIEIVSWSICLTLSATSLGITSVIYKNMNNGDYWENQTLATTIRNWILDTEEIWNDRLDTTDPPPPSGDQIHKILVATLLLTSAAATISTARIITGVALLLGIQKNNLKLVKSWLVVKSIFLFCTVCVFTVSFFPQFQENIPAYLPTNIISYISGFAFAQGIYFIHTIFELMSEMQIIKDKSSYKISE